MTRRRPSRAVLVGSLAAMLVLAGVLVAVLGGGGHSKAPSRSPAGRANREVAAAAAYLGLPAGAVRRELRAGQTLEEIAVSHHKSVPGLVDRLLAEREAAGAQARAPAQGKAPSGRAGVEFAIKRGGFGGPAVIGANLLVASRYLGVPRAQLRHELLAGRTLAQIAAARPGRSVGGLLDALVAARHRALLAARAAGTVSAAYVTRVTATLRARLTTAVKRQIAH